MADMKQKVFIPSEIKMLVQLEPIGELRADDYEFEVEAKTWQQKVVRLKKSDTIRVDENSRIVVIDSANVGAGDLKIRIKAQIPDSDMPDQYRTEICVLDTDIQVVECNWGD